MLEPGRPVPIEKIRSDHLDRGLIPHTTDSTAIELSKSEETALQFYFRIIRESSSLSAWNSRAKLPRVYDEVLRSHIHLRFCHQGSSTTWMGYGGAEQ